MISKEKIKVIKEINTDYSDLLIKINEYLSHKYEYIENSVVFENIELLKKQLKQKNQDASTLHLIFSNKKENFEIENVLNIQSAFDVSKLNTPEMFYAGKKYDLKLKEYKENIEILLKERTQNIQNIAFIIDISAISSYPLWDTVMRRYMKAVAESIEKLELRDISEESIEKIIKFSKPQAVKINGKIDLDFFILCMKMVSEKSNVSLYIIDSEKTTESIFFTNELIKFAQALKMDKDEKYEYIYDTVCKDMDEMFSKYGFCNFKENKCVAQRHKTLFNRYPTPKTDGCCFKVVRKCEHNNKDGTCKVKCLPCKLFTCPYLGKLHIGIRASELILMRAFLNNRQKRISIYKFYNSKEFLLKKIKEKE